MISRNLQSFNVDEEQDKLKEILEKCRNLTKDIPEEAALLTKKDTFDIRLLRDMPLDKALKELNDCSDNLIKGGLNTLVKKTNLDEIDEFISQLQNYPKLLKCGMEVWSNNDKYKKGDKNDILYTKLKDVKDNIEITFSNNTNQHIEPNSMEIDQPNNSASSTEPKHLSSSDHPITPPADEISPRVNNFYEHNEAERRNSTEHNTKLMSHDTLKRSLSASSTNDNAQVINRQYSSSGNIRSSNNGPHF